MKGQPPPASEPQDGKLLVVDDDPRIREVLGKLLRSAGYQVREAASAEEALEALRREPPDLVLLDIQLPGRSGHAVLLEIRANARTRLTPVIMLTGAATGPDKIKAFQAGVTDYVSKPFVTEELMARVNSLVRLKLFTDLLEDAENVIVALARAIDARDPYTANHSARVSFYAGLLGDRIGLKGSELGAVKRGGLFHDLGKIAIRDSVLLKPGKLTEEEFAEIKRHPLEGRKLIEDLKTLRFAVEVVHHHHERIDGSGYPDGLAGDGIPLVARVTTIADIFDALTTARVYRAALSREESLRIMGEETRKGWWDGRLLDEFRGALETVPPGDERIERPGFGAIPP
jgi:putative two-component system response regulator